MLQGKDFVILSHEEVSSLLRLFDLMDRRKVIEEMMKDQQVTAGFSLTTSLGHAINPTDDL